jgi:hypothetical protein
MKGFVTLVSTISILCLANGTYAATVKPGDEITPKIPPSSRTSSVPETSCW